MRPLFIFDIDGTLADPAHRIHILKEDGRGDDKWRRFYGACLGDKPIEPVIQTLNLLLRSADIRFFTGRSEEVRSLTVSWLSWHGVMLLDDEVDEALVMRAIGDHTADHNLKIEWWKAMSSEDRARLVGVFEDRQSVVDAWRAHGVTCFQVAKGDF